MLKFSCSYIFSIYDDLMVLNRVEHELTPREHVRS